MALVRFGQDNSNVYIFYTSEVNEGEKIECCGCSVASGQSIRLDSEEDMLAHVALHRREGQTVPYYVDRMLIVAIEDGRDVAFKVLESDIALQALKAKLEEEPVKEDRITSFYESLTPEQVRDIHVRLGQALDDLGDANTKIRKLEARLKVYDESAPSTVELIQRLTTDIAVRDSALDHLSNALLDIQETVNKTLLDNEKTRLWFE